MRLTPIFSRGKDALIWAGAMTLHIRRGAAALALLSSLTHGASAQARKSSTPDSSKTQVLVLATPHLATFGADYRTKALEPLLEVLARYKPDLICIERFSGTSIASMRALTPVFDELLQSLADYERNAQTMRNRLAVTRFQADTLSLRLTSRTAGVGAISDSDRSQLVQLFLAASDVPSAVLHWSQLASAAKADTAMFPNATASFLNSHAAARNEDVSVGTVLAARLGLSRLYSIDDLSDEVLLASQARTLSGEVAKYAADLDRSFYERLQARTLASWRDDNLLPIYEYMNSPEFAADDTRIQWEFFLRNRMANDLGRTRIALWEMRNLNITSNIRRASASVPGGKVLVIIGASHRPFIEGFLRQSMDVQVIDFATLLKR